MFNGLGVACFSPSVDRNVRLTWKDRGGSIAVSFDELASVNWFFAAVDDMDWITSLRGLSVVVYDQRWVLHSAQAGYRVFLESYVLPAESPATHKWSIVPRISKWNPCQLPGKKRSHSEVEVELTLVQDEDSAISSVTTLVDDPCSELAPLLKTLTPNDTLRGPPIVTIDSVCRITPAVSSCTYFRAGGSLDGTAFHARRLPLASILKM